MLSKAPQSRVASFNLAEMAFLQGRYTEADPAFAALEAAQREADPALSDLCRFKRVVCKLALDQLAEAEKLLPILEKTVSSPAVQYSRAALLYAQKHFERASEAIGEARNTFSPGVENLYVDSLIELRWGSRDSAGQFSFNPRP